MDRRIPPEIEREIKAIIEDMPFPYAGYHKLRTRFSGNKKYVDFHLLTCRKLHIDEAHDWRTRSRAGSRPGSPARRHGYPCGTVHLSRAS